MSGEGTGSSLPPALEEMIAKAVAREMRRSREDRTVLEFLASNNGMRLPDGADLLFEELRHSPTAIRGPRCSICGDHSTGESIGVCGDCGRRLCEGCSADGCKCGSALRISVWRHLLDALRITTGLLGTWSPCMGFLYLLTQDSLAAAYFAASIVALLATAIHNRSVPWTGILRESAWQGS
jgi:hypothetical protein